LLALGAQGVVVGLLQGVHIGLGLGHVGLGLLQGAAGVGEGGKGVIIGALIGILLRLGIGEDGLGRVHRGLGGLDVGLVGLGICLQGLQGGLLLVQVSLSGSHRSSQVIIGALHTGKD